METRPKGWNRSNKESTAMVRAADEPSEGSVAIVQAQGDGGSDPSGEK